MVKLFRSNFGNVFRGMKGEGIADHTFFYVRPYHPNVNRTPPLKDQIRGSVISGHFLRIRKCRGSVINTKKISGIPGGQLLTLKISGNFGPRFPLVNHLKPQSFFGALRAPIFSADPNPGGHLFTDFFQNPKIVGVSY